MNPIKSYIKVIYQSSNNKTFLNLVINQLISYYFDKFSIRKVITFSSLINPIYSLSINT